MKSKKLWSAAACVLLLGVGLCCQRKHSTGEATVIVIETDKQPTPVVVPPPPPPSDPQMPSWLFPSAFKPGTQGGWVKGEFDRKKNKLIVRTNDVREFAVNSSEVPIDWDKLVILSIDGKNSELRKRDFTVYRFELDSHGQWVVVEPK